MTDKTKIGVRIFISHSSADAGLAEALADLLQRALKLDPPAIRCTSVTDYSLSAGVRVEDQLRTEIEQSEVLIALIPEAALSSTYVLFELGARWGLQRPLFPLLAKGLKAASLKEPLKALAAASCDRRGEVLKLIETLSATLSLVAAEASTYDRAVARLLAASKTHSARRPTSLQPDTTQLSLSVYEIVALQAISEGGYAPMLEDIIGHHLDITSARARQALESIRRKGLVACRLRSDGDVEYFHTLAGTAWLNSNVRAVED